MGLFRFHCMFLFALMLVSPARDAYASSKYRKPTAREMYIHRTRMIDRAAVGKHGYPYRYKGVRYYRQNFRDVRRKGKERDRVKDRGHYMRTHATRPDGLVGKGKGKVRPYWYPWTVNLNRTVAGKEEYYGSEFLTSHPFLRFYWYPWVRNLNDKIVYDKEMYGSEFMAVREFYENRYYPRRWYFEQNIRPLVFYYDQEFEDSYHYYRYLKTPTKHAVKYKKAKSQYLIVDRQPLPDPMLDSIPRLYNPGRRFLASPEKPTEKPKKKRKLNYTLDKRALPFRFRNSDNR